MSSGAPGCLQCLLAGGEDEATSRIFQHYEVSLANDGASLAELGRGAMGITYRAVDLNLGVPVALKVISARYSQQHEARKRFREEARVAARLRHPNVASVFHFGETPEGHCFYAMELVEGGTLEDRVRREGSLGAEVVLEIGAQVARALMAAEKHVLIHRDLKPSNLMLVPNEQSSAEDFLVKVIDFGLARIVGEHDAPSSGFSGTPGFASPEQTAADARTIDARSDIYSLGATLWFALCGHAPAADEALPRVLETISGKAPEPLVRLHRRMLAPQPDDRPQSARHLLEEIERCRAELVAARRRPRRFAAMAILGLFMAAGLFAIVRPFWSAPPEKSIAVLPFENRSKDSRDTYLAVGVQDAVLSDLARIADLKVISRRSVMPYASATRASVKNISRELGVANVLEGSVQRSGGRVRINVQLIDVVHDRELWSEDYDRDAKDVFGLESEIARRIADELQARISPSENSLLTENPTANLQAYARYAEALTLDFWCNPENWRADFKRKEELLRGAIRLDPTFLQAYCALARLYFNWHNQNHFFGGSSPASLQSWEEAVDTAMRLRPDLGEPHLERARYYLFRSEFDRAQKEIEIARRLLPNDSEAIFTGARIERRLNHWNEALQDAVAANALNPRDNLIAVWTAETFRLTRRYEEGLQFMKRMQERLPALNDALRDEEVSIRLAQGKLDAAQKLLAEFPPEAEFEHRFQLALYRRAYDEAARLVAAAHRRDLGPLSSGKSPETFYDAVVDESRGDGRKARSIYQSLKDALLVPTSQDIVDRADYYQLLSGYEAELGEKVEAVRDATEATRLVPVARDPFRGAEYAEGLAEVYASVGDRGHALDQLSLLARIPGTTSYGDLLYSDSWDSLRGDPRFDKLIASLKPKS
ncbi:MAG: protein kinase [Chthoniobacterales bacterium]|nr:protein kinase [Chthoniobacterales bacterium]